MYIFLDKINQYFPGVPWQVPVIILLVFLLIVTLAQVRHHFINWSFKGASFGIFLGFVLAIITEGFLFIYGRNFISSVLGWQDAPEPISIFIQTGRDQLQSALGDTKQEVGSTNIVDSIQSLPPEEVDKVKSLVCEPNP